MERKRMRIQLVVIIPIMFVLVMFTPLVSHGEWYSYSWIGGSDGWYSSPDNWSPKGYPMVNDYARLESLDGIDRTVSIPVASSPNSYSVYLYDLTINSRGTGSMTLNLEGGLNRTQSATIGYSGSATLNQNGGAFEVDDFLHVGVGYNYDTGNGRYNLNAGDLYVGSLIVGSGGKGTFTQYGGYNHVQDRFIISEGSSYNLQGGSLAVGAVFGTEIGSTKGAATFNQTGGDHSSGQMFLGHSYNPNIRSTGIYNLTDGTLRAVNIQIGNGGTFNQTGGLNENRVGVQLGQNGDAKYNLSNGTLSNSSVDVGFYGNGTFNQTGGTHNITNRLTIKQQYNGPDSGIYNLSGGTLNATTVINNDRFNYSGGTLNGNLTNNVGATTTLSGVGTRTVNGSVINYGTIKVKGATDGTVAVFNGAFANNGVLDTDPARLEFHDSFTIGAEGIILASEGDQYVMYGDFINNSTNTSAWSTSGVELIFNDLGSHKFYLGDAALTWKELSIEGGATLAFEGTGSLFAGIFSGLTINPDGTVTNILGSSGFDLFYDPLLNPGLNGGTFQLAGGGAFSPMTNNAVPIPGAIWLLGSGLVGLIGLRKKFSK